MTPTRTTKKATAEGIPSQLAYLSRVLKTPTIGRVWEEIADHAREENWSHEEYLAAVMQRQVADRESAGSIMRIRTAHFPAVKTIEDVNLDHLPSLRRDVLAHLAMLTFNSQSRERDPARSTGNRKDPPGNRSRSQGNAVRILGAVRHREQLDCTTFRSTSHRTTRSGTEKYSPLQVDHHRRGLVSRVQSWWGEGGAEPGGGWWTMSGHSSNGWSCWAGPATQRAPIGSASSISSAGWHRDHSMTSHARSSVSTFPSSVPVRILQPSMAGHLGRSIIVLRRWPRSSRS